MFCFSFLTAYVAYGLRYLSLYIYIQKEGGDSRVLQWGDLGVGFLDDGGGRGGVVKLLPYGKGLQSSSGGEGRRGLTGSG